MQESEYSTCLVSYIVLYSAFAWVGVRIDAGQCPLTRWVYLVTRMHTHRSYMYTRFARVVVYL